MLLKVRHQKVGGLIKLKSKQLHSYYTTFAGISCQGVYSRKYASLHDDRTGGTTNLTKLWDDGRENATTYTNSSGEEFNVMCTSLQQWKQLHPGELQKFADMPLYYQVYPKETVKVTISGNEVTYVGTIRAMHGATKGACTGKASATGPQPYTCVACDALVHGKTSSLNRKLCRSMSLKHPRFSTDRAIKVGVTHKYCSADHLQIALQNRKTIDTK